MSIASQGFGAFIASLSCLLEIVSDYPWGGMSIPIQGFGALVPCSLVCSKWSPSDSNFAIQCPGIPVDSWQTTLRGQENHERNTGLKGIEGGWRKTKGDGGEKLDCFSNNQVKMLHFSQLSYHSCANWMIHLFCNGWGLSCGGKWLVGATFACHGDLIMLLNFSTEMITEGQWSGDPQSYVATQ